MSNQSMPSDGDIVKFLRHSDYRFVKSLGRGACGVTVLLYDEEIDKHFVCKKYSPLDGLDKADLFQRFRQEIRLLYKLNHVNVVRIYNHFLYPSQHLGFLIMEFVEGHAIDKYLSEHPDKLDHIFRQSVRGFQYLASQQVLHRDIRPENFLVQSNGELKIIDLGFGKEIGDPKGFDRSISLNWRYDIPEEFQEGGYDFSTEVYFVGKLFEEIAGDIGVDAFKYGHILSQMCEKSTENRISSFSGVVQDLFKSEANVFESRFSSDEIHTYRMFSDALADGISKIDSRAQYYTDVKSIQAKLEDIFKQTTLEKNVAVNLVAGCFLRGNYYFHKTGIASVILHEFVRLFHSCTQIRQREILGNLQTRLDSLQRYYHELEGDDDIPF